MVKHPFNEGTKLAKIFTILSDTEWHCGKHELPGTQPAKAIQIIRQHGFQIENQTIFCKTCKDKTVHRRLLSIEPVAKSIARIQISSKLRKRILKYYKNREAITCRKMEPPQLEVDHRFPQVRWTTKEFFDPNMSDREIGNRFQLLTREHNLWKSRYCEHCKKTDERGTFIGINFFAQGGPKWDPNISVDEEKGCYGCFWFDPEKWRKAINKKIKKFK
ncbi:hypothetical protein KJ713_00875 [Patescibacteria group bacterium]|nr:hypothetical protein [Patescibacteria group bacterium]